MNRTLESPKLKINPCREQLFVNKQIDQYEPVKSVHISDFKADPNQKAKKKFPSIPQSHAEIRDSQAELSGFDL